MEHFNSYSSILREQKSYQARDLTSSLSICFFTINIKKNVIKSICKKKPKNLCYLRNSEKSQAIFFISTVFRVILCINKGSTSDQ